MTVCIFFLPVLLLAACLYLILMAAVIAGLGRMKKEGSGPGPVPTNISIIIPARNEAGKLGQCLEDLLACDPDPVKTEILVVDDFSSDDTAGIATRFAARHPSFPMKLIRMQDAGLPEGSKKAAIELGVRHASGELILAADADTRRDKNWIRAIAGFYERHHPKMILGPVSFDRESSLLDRLQSLEFMGLMGATAGSCRSGFPLLCNGANLAYEKRAFLETGGFSGNKGIVSGDDMFLMMKIRKRYGAGAIRFLLTEDAAVRTLPAQGLREFFFQRIRWVSKTKGYRDPAVVASAVITWLFSFLLIAGLIAGIFCRPILIASLLTIFLKLIAEYIPVARMAGFFRKKNLLPLFPVAGILNIFYTVFIGIAGMGVPYTWKARKVTSVS